MTIALYQTSLAGHHGAYAKAISMAAQAKGWRTKVLIPESAGGYPALREIASTIGPENLVYSPLRIPAFKAADPYSLIRYHFKQHSIASTVLAAVRGVDFIYIPTLDQMDQAIRVLGPPSKTPMAGMSMRIRFHLPSKSKNTIKQYLQVRAGAAYLKLLLSPGKMRGLMTADPILAEYCKLRSDSLSRVAYIPEIGMDRLTITRQQARRELGFAAEDKIILLYGALSGRKALAELIQGVRLVNVKGPLRILVMGEVQEPAMKAYLESAEVQQLMRSGKLVAKTGFADNTSESLAFAAADAVWVAYKNHATMSGVFYQAICCGLPVIAPNYGVLGWLASRYEVGPVVDINDPISTGNQITRLFEDEGERQRYADNACAIAEAHRPLSFGLSVCEAITNLSN